jgi:hypothetical protein
MDLAAGQRPRRHDLLRSPGPNAQYRLEVQCVTSHIPIFSATTLGIQHVLLTFLYL